MADLKELDDKIAAVEAAQVKFVGDVKNILTTLEGVVSDLQAKLAAANAPVDLTSENARLQAVADAMDAADAGLSSALSPPSP